MATGIEEVGSGILGIGLAIFGTILIFLGG